VSSGGRTDGIDDGPPRLRPAADAAPSRHRRRHHGPFPRFPEGGISFDPIADFAEAAVAGRARTIVVLYVVDANGVWASDELRKRVNLIRNRVAQEADGPGLGEDNRTAPFEDERRQ